MSVIKAKRAASPFQVLQTATDLRKELTTYVMRDFAIDGKLTNMEAFVLNDERTELLHDVRNMVACIEMANSIYITSIDEYTERRKYQDYAIGYCNRLIQELQYIVDTFPHKINVHKYGIAARMASEERGLLKAWRKSDNKVKKRLLEEQGS